MIDIKSLEDRISPYDCEEWTATEGREIIARLKAAHDESVKLALACLKNMGHDVDCGACMEIAFCGMTTCTHDCFPAISVEERLKFLPTVEQAIADISLEIRLHRTKLPWWKRWIS